MILKSHEIRYIKNVDGGTAAPEVSKLTTFTIENETVVIDSEPSREERTVSQRVEKFKLFKPVVVEKKMDLFAMNRSDPIEIDMGYMLRWKCEE